MSYTAITKPTQGDATKKSLADALIDNDAYFKTELDKVAVLQIPNGSFELPGTAGVLPDRWVKVENSGWTIATDDTDAGSGRFCVLFTTPGSTVGVGAQLTSGDYFEVSPNRPVAVSWEQKSSVAAIRVLVQILWFDATLTADGSATIYDSTANPTSWAAEAGTAASPPSTARYAKLRFECDDSGNTTAGTVRFDSIAFNAYKTIPSLVVLDTGASSPWVVPGGITRIRVKVWGGGADGETTHDGGAGGYGEDIFDVTPGTSYVVTIGAGGGAGAHYGGTTSLGALISATGGEPGSAGSGGAGGTSSATINVTGGAGGFRPGSAGGGGGSGGGGSSAVNGGDGMVPGGGGARGSSSPGDGGDGRIIIEY